MYVVFFFFFFQAEDGIRDGRVTGVQTCALPISPIRASRRGRYQLRLPSSVIVAGTNRSGLHPAGDVPLLDEVAPFRRLVDTLLAPPLRPKGEVRTTLAVDDLLGGRAWARGLAVASSGLHGVSDSRCDRPRVGFFCAENDVDARKLGCRRRKRPGGVKQARKTDPFGRLSSGYARRSSAGGASSRTRRTSSDGKASSSRRRYSRFSI